jgi:hypothetical protein
MTEALSSDGTCGVQALVCGFGRIGRRSPEIILQQEFELSGRLDYCVPPLRKVSVILFGTVFNGIFVPNRAEIDASCKSIWVEDRNATLLAHMLQYPHHFDVADILPICTNLMTKLLMHGLARHFSTRRPFD